MRKVRFKLKDMEEGLVNVNVQDDTLGIDFNDREDANLEDAF